MGDFGTKKGWDNKNMRDGTKICDGTFWDEKRPGRDENMWDEKSSGTGHQFLASPVAKVNYSVTNKFLGIIVKPWSSRISHVGCDTVRNLNF